MAENPRKDHRTTIVHFANSAPEHIQRLKDLGAIVSANPYYVTAFANKYSEVGVGPERAQAMVRLAPLEDLGVSISLHSDLPMAPADPLYLAWAAVTRDTLEGGSVMPELGLSVDKALRAITIDAAYSWRMEDEIGSIAVGKVANFTILDENPYEVSRQQLKDVGVWGTVFEGRVFPVSR
jgi:predicted amidohydrolase YtcJ